MTNKHNFKNQEGKNVLTKSIVFPVRDKGNWSSLKSDNIFKNKKVVIFGLPGAFTPTCSSTHLPRYEELYEVFKENGIDEVYCLSVNDTFVMNEWAKAQNIKNVKMLPDGNKEFTDHIGMLVAKNDLGFGDRSWRYSILIDNGVVTKHFIEEDVEGDPFDVSDADTMLKHVNPNVKFPSSVIIFTKEDCNFCKDAKELLKEKGLTYNEIMLPDANRQKVLSGITGKVKSTAPQIFIDGKLIGGHEELKKYFNK